MFMKTAEDWGLYNHVGDFELAAGILNMAALTAVKQAAEIYSLEKNFDLAMNCAWGCFTPICEMLTKFGADSDRVKYVFGDLLTRKLFQ